MCRLFWEELWKEEVIAKWSEVVRTWTWPYFMCLSLFPKPLQPVHYQSMQWPFMIAWHLLSSWYLVTFPYCDSSPPRIDFFKAKISQILLQLRHGLVSCSMQERSAEGSKAGPPACTKASELSSRCNGRSGAMGLLGRPWQIFWHPILARDPVCLVFAQPMFFLAT